MATFADIIRKGDVDPAGINQAIFALPAAERTFWAEAIQLWKRVYNMGQYDQLDVIRYLRAATRLFLALAGHKESHDIVLAQSVEAWTFMYDRGRAEFDMHTIFSLPARYVVHAQWTSKMLAVPIAGATMNTDMPHFDLLASKWSRAVSASIPHSEHWHETDPFWFDGMPTMSDVRKYIASLHDDDSIAAIAPLLAPVGAEIEQNMDSVLHLGMDLDFRVQKLLLPASRSARLGSPWMPKSLHNRWPSIGLYSLADQGVRMRWRLKIPVLSPPQDRPMEFVLLVPVPANKYVGNMVESLLDMYTNIPTETVVAVVPRIAGEPLETDEIRARCAAALFYLIRTERDEAAIRQKMENYMKLTQQLVFGNVKSLQNLGDFPNLEMTTGVNEYIESPRLTAATTFADDSRQVKQAFQTMQNRSNIRRAAFMLTRTYMLGSLMLSAAGGPALFMTKPVAADEFVVQPSIKLPFDVHAEFHANITEAGGVPPVNPFELVNSTLPPTILSGPILLTPPTFAPLAPAPLPTFNPPTYTFEPPPNELILFESAAREPPENWRENLAVEEANVLAEDEPAPLLQWVHDGSDNYFMMQSPIMTLVDFGSDLTMRLINSDHVQEAMAMVPVYANSVIEQVSRLPQFAAVAASYLDPREIGVVNTAKVAMAGVVLYEGYHMARFHKMSFASRFALKMMPKTVGEVSNTIGMISNIGTFLDTPMGESTVGMLKEVVPADVGAVLDTTVSAFKTFSTANMSWTTFLLSLGGVGALPFLHMLMRDIDGYRTAFRFGVKTLRATKDKMIAASPSLFRLFVWSLSLLKRAIKAGFAVLTAMFRSGPPTITAGRAPPKQLMNMFDDLEDMFMIEARQFAQVIDITIQKAQKYMNPDGMIQILETELRKFAVSGLDFRKMFELRRKLVAPDSSTQMFEERFSAMEKIIDDALQTAASKTARIQTRVGVRTIKPVQRKK